MANHEKPKVSAFKSLYITDVPTKTTLLRGVGSGDSDSWHEFYSLYSRASLIYLISYHKVPRADAEDIVQEKMIKAADVANSYLKKADRRGFRLYLGKALYLSYLSLIRKPHRKYESVPVTESSAELQSPLEERPDSLLESDEAKRESYEMCEIVESLVRELTPEPEALYRVWREEVLTKKKPFREVAKQLGQPESTLRSRHKRLLDELYNKLSFLNSPR